MIESIHAPSLAAILPESILQDEKLLASAKALDRELAKLSEAVIETLHLPRIDELPEHVVDLLGWQFHVENYGMSLPLEVKRELVKTSILVHRRKGTKYAIETTVSQFFSPVEAVPWHEYGGHPFTFRLSFQSYEGFSEERGIAFLRKIVNDVKSERDRLGYAGEPTVSFECELRMDDDEGMIRVNVVPYRNGKHSIHHIEPPDESEMLAYSATGFHRQGRHAITIGPAELSVETPLFSGLATFRAGKIRIPADLSELPQDIWDILTDSVVEGFAGIGRYSCGKHAIGIQLPEDGGAALAYGVGTARIGIKRTGIEVSSGTEKDVRYGLGTSRTGRISIYADFGDIPPSHMPSSHVGLIHVGLGHIGCSKGGK